MAKLYDSIDAERRAFIEKQHMFFVATAPLDADGHVNLSPKGHDCFRILDEHKVCYLDLTGSGNETSGHLAENGRITFMWCAFDGSANIMRLYGKGHTALPGSPEFESLIGLFPQYPGVRQIIVADIDRVQSSCGYAVPKMKYTGERETLNKWAEQKSEAQLADYHRSKNTSTIDGLRAPIADVVGT